MAPAHWQLKTERDLFVCLTSFNKFWVCLLCRGAFCSELTLASTLPNSAHEIHSGDQTLASLFPCRVWFDLKVHVITEQTPHIHCRADVFLVAGITFLTCNLQAGNFSTINHGEATSICEFLWKQSCGRMFTTTDTVYLCLSHYWSKTQPSGKIQRKSL